MGYSDKAKNKVEKPVTKAGLQALLSLLADEDSDTAKVARDHLIEAGELALSTLLEAEGSDDARLRVRVRPILDAIRQKGLEACFEQLPLGYDGEPDLERGAIAVAQFAHPGLDPAECTDELDRIAGLVRRVVGGAFRRLDAIEALNQVLFQDLRFEGNTIDYYDPDNSYLNRVLEKRVGLPISLSVVYLLVARRLNLPVHGVGMPAHFLVKYETPRDEIFIDPFNRGMFLTREDCLERIGNVNEGFAELFLMRTPTRRILVRMLANLRYSYQRNSMDPRPAQLERFIRILLSHKKGA